MINKIFTSQVKEYFLYSASFALNKLGIFILLPLYTSVLSVDEYGYFELISTIVAFAIPIGLLGIDNAIVRFYSYSDELYNNTINKSIDALYFKSLLIFIFSSVILYFLYFSNFPDSEIIGFLFFCKICIDSFLKINLNRLRMNENSSSYFVLNIFVFLFSFFSAFVLIKTMHNNILALLISYCLAGLLPAIYLILTVNYNFRFSVKLTKTETEIYRYSLPVVLMIVVNTALSLSDRFLIEYYLGYEDLGLYSAGFRLGSLIQLCTMGLLIVWPSKALKMKELDNSKVLISKYIFNVVILLSLLSLLFPILIKQGYSLYYPKNYLESFVLVPIITMSFVVLALESYLSIGIFYSKKTKIKLYLSAICLLVNILLNVIFLPLLGYVFAAYTTLLSSLLLLFLSYLFSKKYFQIVNINKIVVIILTFLMINYFLWIF